MNDSNDLSLEEVGNDDSKYQEIKILTPAPFWRQLGTMLKISFLQRLRALTIVLEIVLPLIFLVFECLFAAKVDPLTESVPHPEADQIVPFAVIAGPSPSYGMIPDNAETAQFIDVLSSKSYVPMKDNVIYFDTFQEYKEFIWDNREVNDMFYSSEWTHSADFNENNIRISSNGMTLGSLPFLVQNLGSTVINMTRPAIVNNPTLFLNYKPFPHPPIHKSDITNSLYVAIFSTVQPMMGVLTTGIYYGTEAESGLRDLFTFFGVSFFVNELRWYILSVVMLFVTSIPFAIALSAFIKINFGLMLIFYLLSSTSYSSFLFFMMSLWPTHQMGNITGYGILFTFFICIFWGFFDWLYKDSGYVEKYVLSILPHAALSFTMAQIGSGEITKFSQLDGPVYYPVKYGFTYLAVESVVYFGLYILIESLKKRLWLPAPIHWGSSLKISRVSNEEDKEAIVVDGITKRYGKTVAVNNISFSVNQGETLAIIGPNGAGKSTLMSLLSAMMHLTEGHIYFKGIDIMQNIKAIHEVVGLCPQENLFMNELTADEWMKAVCSLRNEPNFDYDEIFMTLGLDQQKHYRIGKMSGGNKRKTCLAAALACNPPIVILDEATSGVDFTSRTRIWSIISGLSNTTVVMATHTLEECEKIADRIMVLVGGKIAELATPNNLRQIFKCGYLITTDEENGDEFERIAKEAGVRNSLIKEDGKAKLSIPSDDSEALSHILHKVNFKYILTIQSLEEQIFNHIQMHEMKQLNSDEDPSDASLCESDYVTDLQSPV